MSVTEVSDVDTGSISDVAFGAKTSPTKLQNGTKKKST